MCGPSFHAGSQSLFTYIQPWPASSLLCLSSRSQKTCQTEHFYYSGVFHLPSRSDCSRGLLCDLSEVVFRPIKPNKLSIFQTSLVSFVAYGFIRGYKQVWGQLWSKHAKRLQIEYKSWMEIQNVGIKNLNEIRSWGRGWGVLGGNFEAPIRLEI